MLTQYADNLYHICLVARPGALTNERAGSLLDEDDAGIYQPLSTGLLLSSTSNSHR